MIVKSNNLVEVRYSGRYSRFELLLINEVLRKLSKDDQNFSNYIINIKDLCKSVGIKFTSDIYGRLRKSIIKINRIGIDVDGTTIDSWFSDVRFLPYKSSLSFKINPELRCYLLGLKRCYTKINVVNYLSLNSYYSMRIYELLKQYQKIGKRTINLDDMRSYLGIPDNYRFYGSFKQRILIPAILDICRNTDIKIDFNELKFGRKVIALVFRIVSQIRKRKLFDIFLERSRKFVKIGWDISLLLPNASIKPRYIPVE